MLHCVCMYEILMVNVTPKNLIKTYGRWGGAYYANKDAATFMKKFSTSIWEISYEGKVLKVPLKGPIQGSENFAQNFGPCGGGGRLYCKTAFFWWKWKKPKSTKPSLENLHF